MAGRAYTCHHCGGEFVKMRTDDAANAEAEALWGIPQASTDPAMVEVCDDCFRDLMRWYHTRDKE